MRVQYSPDGPVAIVTIDRPGPRNAVDRTTAPALIDACRTVDADSAPAVTAITGAGDAFCAGAAAESAITPDL